MVVAADEPALLEITVISGEALTLSGRPIRKNAFAILSTGHQTHVSTRPDVDGGSYPRWNEKFSLALPPSARAVSVEVRCKKGSLARTLGTASVPVSDFYGGILPADYVHFLSYRLRDPRGERNGIVNLSIRVSAPHQPSPQLAPPSWAPRGIFRAEVALGIPVRRVNVDKSVGGS